MKNNKITKIVGNSMNYFISISLIVSGILKLVTYKPYQDVLLELNPYYAENIQLLGGIAVLSGLLFALPKTFTLGFIATLVFLGGTISAHMQHGDNYIPQIVFVLVTVLAAYFKRNEWFHPNKIS